ncbi:MAG: flagellar motor protein MotB [Burkholderiales bacterium]|nr:flagellar motor protein MotB [Sulfuricellaceae bacterium]
MSDDSQRPIIIKRIKKGSHAAHGGAWKIAYADFVTAMMAFFLLMWLLSSSSKATLVGIGEYFKTPFRVAMQGGKASGDSSTLIQGGGTDLTKTVGEVHKSDQPIEKRVINLREAKGELEKQEKVKLEELKKKLEKMIDSNPNLKQFKNQIFLDITRDGLRIQIVDEKNRPMFDLGSAHIKDYAKVILQEIGRVLNDVPNRITLSGHTDATPYSGGETGYSNWELSSDRANASRRALIQGGMDDKKMLRVVGLSSAVMFDKSDPYNPVNRRISIIVMNKQAEDSVLQESEPVQVANGQNVPVKQSIETGLKH